MHRQLTHARRDAVLLKNPADFVGSVLGESEKNTKGILAATVGKVLVIDEVRASFGLVHSELVG